MCFFLEKGAFGHNQWPWEWLTRNSQRLGYSISTATFHTGVWKMPVMLRSHTFVNRDTTVTATARAWKLPWTTCTAAASVAAWTRKLRGKLRGVEYKQHGVSPSRGYCGGLTVTVGELEANELLSLNSQKIVFYDIRGL